MAELSFQVNLPGNLREYGISQKKIQQKILEWTVVALFNEGQISSGKAGKLLKMSRVEFLDLLRERGFSYINYSSDELEEEFRSVKSLKPKKSK